MPCFPMSRQHCPLLTLTSLLVILLFAGCGKKADSASVKPTDPPSITPGKELSAAPTAAAPVSQPVAAVVVPEPTAGPVVREPKPVPFFPQPQPTAIELAPMPHAPGEKSPDPVVVAQSPKPVEPTAPVPTGGGTPVVPAPKKIEYPKQIDGKDLLWWLNEARKNPDPQVRQNALNVIPSFGPDARKPSINPLVEVVDYDRDPGVRMAAITLLSMMGYEDRVEERKAVHAILRALANAAPGTLIRAYCVKSIGSFGPDAASPIAIENLRKCLFDPSWETRLAATSALGSVGMPPYDEAKDKKGEPKKTTEPKKASPTDPPQFDPKGPNPDALKALILHSLNDECASVRMEAAQSLIRCGPPVPRDKNEYSRAIEDFLKPINKKVNEKDDMMRVNTLREKNLSVLVWLLVVQIMYNGETMKDNIARIASYIKNPDKIVQVNALTALASLGPRASPAVREVIDALSYDEPALLAAAMTCLAAMGKDGGSALPELEKIKNGSKDPKKPENAPADWKPDDTLRKIAADAIEYVTGRKVNGAAPPEEPKKN